MILKGVTLLTLLSTLLFSTVTISYDRNNDDAQTAISQTFNGVDNISLSPAPNEGKALYELGNFDQTVMAVCYSSTLDGIAQHGGSNKLSKYMLVTPLVKGELHLIVRKDSKFKSIYDLERRNISMGYDGSAVNLTAKSIFVDANIAVSEFNYELNEAMRRLLGGGIDAVVAIGHAPISILQNYEGKFKLLNVPSTGNYKSATIQGSKYGLGKDTMTFAGDLLLIAKKDAVAKYSLNTLLSSVTRNLLQSNNSTLNEICSNNGNYGLSVSPSLRSSCTQYQNELASQGSSEVVITLDLLRQANSIGEIEIYNDALRHNTAVGGLSFDTEQAKLKQLSALFAKEKGAKLLIKSYVNSSEGDAYSNAQYIFQYLRKTGVNRSNMIIKSFNESSFCHDPNKPYCSFLNRKITFEVVY